MTTQLRLASTCRAFWQIYTATPAPGTLVWHHIEGHSWSDPAGSKSPQECWQDVQAQKAANAFCARVTVEVLERSVQDTPQQHLRALLVLGQRELSYISAQTPGAMMRVGARFAAYAAEIVDTLWMNRDAWDVHTQCVLSLVCAHYRPSPLMEGEMQCLEELVKGVPRAVQDKLDKGPKLCFEACCWVRLHTGQKQPLFWELEELLCCEDRHRIQESTGFSF